MDSGERVRAAILIVEDDVQISRAWAREFSAVGFRTVIAGTLDEARHAVDDCNVGHHRWQAIVLDVLLPDGVSLELLPELETIRPRPALVVASGHVGASRAVILAKAGISLVPKPVTGKQLVDCVVSACLRREDRLASFCKHYGLNGRQRDVLESWLQGLERKETADALGISASSVGTHWDRICKKTGLACQHEVIRHLTRIALGLEHMGEGLGRTASAG